MLYASPIQEVQLPVRDVDGNVRQMKEKCAFSKDIRYPLFASMQRPVVLLGAGKTEQFEVEAADGTKFWAAVDRRNGAPILKVEERVRDMVALNVKSGWRSWATVQEALANADKLSRTDKAELLETLHIRFAHAAGRRLYLTLKEKGVGGVFTEQDCKHVSCEACRLMNRRQARIPKPA